MGSPRAGIPLRLIAAASAVALTILLVDLALPLGVAGGVPYVALVLMGWWFPHRRHTIVLAIIATILTLAGYAFSPPGGVPWVVATNRFLALFAIWVTAILLQGFKLTSELRVARDMAERARQEAEIANAAKSRFLAVMSHELRTPLNAIMGFSEIMAMQQFGPIGNETYREYARDIHSSSDHLLALINDVLNLSAIEAGKQEIRFKDIRIEALIDDCLATIAPQAAEKRIAVIRDVEDALPPLHADPRATRQILLNLLSNAVKYIPPGSQVRANARLEYGFHVLTVEDNGPGIPPEMLPTLTQPFVRSETDPYTRQGSTGLGLAIVKQLVDLHKGILSIRSKPGAGTRISVSIPLPTGTQGSATFNPRAA